jgi:hypothetical protein
MGGIGKLLVAVGLIIVIIGLVVWFGGRVPLLNRLGRLPGDIYVRGDHWSFYFPLTTSIVISIIISILFMLLRR